MNSLHAALAAALAADPSTSPRALTDWDRAYLAGLYGSEQDGVTLGRNLSEVSSAMARQLLAQQGEAAEP